MARNPFCPIHRRRGLVIAPNDFDRTFRGKLTAAEALAESRNIPAMVVLSKVGVETAIGVMDAAGLHGLARQPRSIRALAGNRRRRGQPAWNWLTPTRCSGVAAEPLIAFGPIACWQVLGAISEANRTHSSLP